MTLLAGGEAGQFTRQDFTRLGDVTGEGLGFGEIEIEGVTGTLELTFGSHGKVFGKGWEGLGKKEKGGKVGFALNQPQTGKITSISAF